jgi:acetyl-CoA C-acetyltransferase
VAAKEIDVVEMHDAFSILEFMNPVDLGLLKRGDEVAALKKGETSLGGRLPVNPSGGVKARGHPLGATGVAMAVEIYWQLSRQAGRHQVDGCRVGMTHNIGGFGNNNVVTIMEAVQ